MITTPAIWQAQCRVAALEAVLENGDQVVAVAQPHCIEPSHRTQRELEPVAVGEGSVAVDDSDGGRLAFGDVEEGSAEVEHRGVSEVASESGVAFRNRCPKR